MGENLKGDLIGVLTLCVRMQFKLKTGCPLLTFNRCRDRGIVLLISLEENEHVHFCTKTSFELNCTSKSFSCHFLDLAVNQSPQGRSCYIFDKLSQPEYAVVF